MHVAIDTGKFGISDLPNNTSSQEPDHPESFDLQRIGNSLDGFPGARLFAAENSVNNAQLLDRVLDTDAVQCRFIAEHGQREGFGLSGILIERGQNLATAEVPMRAASHDNCSPPVGGRIKGNLDLQAGIRAERFDGLPPRSLGPAHQAQLPPAAKIRDDADETIGPEVGVALDERNDLDGSALNRYLPGTTQ